MGHVEYSVTEGVATIRLNRTDKRNAFTLEMVSEWAASLRRAEADASVRVVVVTGAGDAFCSGIDVSVLSESPEPIDVLLAERIHAVARAVECLSKPLIAAVRGPAVGAGMDMALMCDIRVADQTATFCAKYIDIGILPGDGGAWLLPRLVGRARALRLLWTAERVTAEEAMGYGIIDTLVDDGDLDAAVGELAARLAAKPPELVRAIKRLVRRGVNEDLLSSLNAVAAEQRRIRDALSTEP